MSPFLNLTVKCSPAMSICASRSPETKFQVPCKRSLSRWMAASRTRSGSRRRVSIGIAPLKVRLTFSDASQKRRRQRFYEASLNGLMRRCMGDPRESALPVGAGTARMIGSPAWLGGLHDHDLRLAVQDVLNGGDNV